MRQFTEIQLLYSTLSDLSVERTLGNLSKVHCYIFLVLYDFSEALQSHAKEEV